ncbi:MAG: hypothetical protein LAQ69_09595 [Acidobacteriia bacterium]|nr:hypothetical protein [Terriglobia bacterium]
MIRSAQMAIFQVVQRKRFEDSMAAHLRVRFAGRDVVADEDRLRTHVREGIKLAGEFGVVAPFDLRRFLEFSTEYGPDFHTTPWAAKILKDSTLSGCGKMEHLDDFTLFSLRS